MMSKILVVEDNLAIAEGLAYNLRHEGHDVRIAEDGEAAVADSRAWSPDGSHLAVLSVDKSNKASLEMLRSDGLERRTILTAGEQGVHDIFDL